MAHCRCGCGVRVKGRFVSGHNLRVLKRTSQHRAAISAALKTAWQTKRRRLPIGTKRLDHSGYVVVKMVAGTGAWKKEHHIVAEDTLGRTLLPCEVVHHINGDRSDNHPRNIYVCRDQRHHAAVHRSEAVALRQLLAAGLIRFTEGLYEAVLRTP